MGAQSRSQTAQRKRRDAERRAAASPQPVDDNIDVPEINSSTFHLPAKEQELQDTGDYEDSEAEIDQLQTDSDGQGSPCPPEKRPRITLLAPKKQSQSAAHGKPKPSVPKKKAVPAREATPPTPPPAVIHSA